MVEPPALLTASAALNAFHVPVVAVTPGFYARWSIYDTFGFSTSFLTSMPPPDSLLIILIVLIIGMFSVGGRHRQNILTTAPDLAGQAR